MSAADSSSSAPHGHVQTLYSEHHRWLQDWLRRRLKHSGDAADLAQDTFLRLLAPAAAGDAPSAPTGALREPRAYLATIARRLLINFLRRRALEQAYLETLALLPEALAPSPEQQLIILQTLQQIDTMLDGLPAKVRTVFILSQIEGLTYAAIAEQMNIGERSVKRYMAQAMTECILLAP
ncbi:sigma-70 family RNA polymerase sigma factor [Achromobacter sp. UMC46]|uniref:sigma-70 family RNA polymerase sigma factor n=1 Tax=Achromobacter sp. UMC46 TaxID=1862319 RepID=UPI0016032A62|nr:sigma-70 family RNA polymerase sigma factor [Achromobacter sp. UMC46]MBB1595704.1 RNA polymerase subunit sigma [Achromobacter sp. UMC46]